MRTALLTIEENIPKQVLQNKEVVIKYDMPAIHQLYSMIRNAKGAMMTAILWEMQYREKLKDCSLIFKRNITWTKSLFFTKNNFIYSPVGWRFCSRPKRGNEPDQSTPLLLRKNNQKSYNFRYKREI